MPSSLETLLIQAQHSLVSGLQILRQVAAKAEQQDEEIQRLTETVMDKEQALTELEQRIAELIRQTAAVEQEWQTMDDRRARP